MIFLISKVHSTTLLYYSTVHSTVNCTNKTFFFTKFFKCPLSPTLSLKHSDVLTVLESILISASMLSRLSQTSPFSPSWTPTPLVASPTNCHFAKTDSSQLPSISRKPVLSKPSAPNPPGRDPEEAAGGLLLLALLPILLMR